MIKKNWIWIAGFAALAIGCSKSADETAGTTTTGTATSGASATAGATGGTTGTTGTSASNAPAYTAVQAIFSSKCTGCHGDHGKGGINLTSYDTVMKGGEEGPIITPGDPDKSKLVDALRGRNGAKQMPFNQAPLPEDQIKVIEDWIKAGAKQS